MRRLTILLLLTACSSEAATPDGGVEKLSAHTSDTASNPDPNDLLATILASAGAEAVAPRDAAVEDTVDAGPIDVTDARMPDAGREDAAASPDTGEPDPCDCDDDDPCTTDFCSDGSCLNTPVQCPDGECRNGACALCGGQDQPCCANDQCSSDLECISGTCRCGGQDQKCCADNMCDANLRCLIIFQVCAPP